MIRNKDNFLPGTALSLLHLLIVVILLRAGTQWGYDEGALAWILHCLLFPGWLAYLVFGTGSYLCLFLTYPLNSALWGFGLAWFWLRLRCARQPRLLKSRPG